MKYLITANMDKNSAIKLAALLSEMTGNEVQVASYEEGQRIHAHIALETKGPLHLNEITDEAAHARYMKNHPQVISVNIKSPRT